MTTLQKIIKYCAVAFAIFLIISIIGGICGALGMASVFFDRDVTGEIKTYTVSSEVKSLDVEISAAELEIITSNSFSVESNHKYLTVKEDKGTLRISEDRPIGGASSGGVTVTITIPVGFVFDDASISAGAGKVNIATLSANTLNLKLGAGKTDIDCLNAKTRSKVDSGAGKLTILGGELHDLSMDVGIGKLELTSKLTGKCSIDYGIGDAKLTLLGGKDDYKIQLDKGIGDAMLDGKSMSDDSVYGSGENQIDIDGGIGAIHIQFEENSQS